jgi:hypothetical protein
MLLVKFRCGASPFRPRDGSGIMTMMWSPRKLAQPGRLADGSLTLALSGLTFLLGCQQLFDADVWWHLHAGRWILEHHAVPRVDPFTFGSAGERWIDLHWLFQVVLALSFAAGGVAGTIVLAAAGAATAVGVGLMLRQGRWPTWIVAAAWIPGVLLASSRFDPRPEIVTLCCLSAFFGILLRARQTPGLLWLLVPIEVLWVNTHGLFVLGPWTLVLFLVDRAVVGGEPPWRRVVLPSLAVVLACLVNPYGVRGLLLPLELFPKLTEAGGAYKAYIGEFMSPRRMVETYWVPVPGHDLYLRLFVFLLTALPLTVLVASLWRSWNAGRSTGKEGSPRVGAWGAGMALALGLALAVAFGLPVPATPVISSTLGKAVPWVVSGVGGMAALLLSRRSWHAAVMAVAGAGAAAGWIVWLLGHLFDNAPHHGAGAVALGLGLAATWLAIRTGLQPFGPLLAASFAALALLAVRNMSLFGMVAGSVLAAELGQWAAELGRGRVPTANPLWWPIAARGAVLGGVGILCWALVTGRLFAYAEDCHRFGLGERPFYYAHDACRFAGRPDLPARALVFGLNQAAVYEFHNGPAHRVYMDGRLEVASRATFETYTRIHERLTAGDGRWANAVGRLGTGLILVDHEDNLNAEATLLIDPRWRCIRLDPVAAIFVPRDQEPAYPTLDFAAKHFHRPQARAVPSDPARAQAEGMALVRLGAVLAHRPVARWSLPIPIDLVAMDRAREATTATPRAAGPWMVLGHAALGLIAEPGPIAAGIAAPLDPSVDLLWAQAASAYRAALARAPRDESVLRPLAALFALRGMDDARRTVEARLQGTRGDSGLTWAAPASRPWPGEAHLAPAIDDLLRQRLPAAAVALAAEMRRRGHVLSWATADRVASAYLNLGEPAEARRAWLEAAIAPSAALRATRLADADLAVWELDAADAGYRRALTLDRQRTDAWVGLALAALERGQADEAFEAARAALLLTTATEVRRRALLEEIVALTAAHAHTESNGP